MSDRSAVYSAPTTRRSPSQTPSARAFAYLFRPEDAAALAGPATLAGNLLTEGADSLSVYLPGRTLPGDREQVLAVARDLDFSGRLLVGF